jgi:cytosine deaminase
MLLTGAQVLHGGLGDEGTPDDEAPTVGRFDVQVTGATVTAIGPPGTISAAVTAAATEPVIDLSGYLLLPAPAEPHAHLDKALTIDTVGNPTGDLVGAITVWMAHRDNLSHADIVERATKAALTLLAHGATAVRTHVDVGEQGGGRLGLRALEALVEVRERVRPVMDVQLVALPGVPLTGVAGAGNRAVLRAAAAAGAELLGGAPHIDPDPVAAAALCLDAASAAGIGLDLHMDETLDPAVCHLDTLAEQAKGIGVPVTASHCVSLAMQPPARQEAIAQALAASGIAVVTLPQTNLYLQARGVATAPPRGLTALRPLLAAGVTLAGGGDNHQDPFNPVGRGDPLETASLLVAAGHLTVGEAWRAVGQAARSAMGVAGGVIAVGAPAELLAVRGSSLAEVVGSASQERLVWHAGCLVADTRITRRIHLDGK